MGNNFIDTSKVCGWMGCVKGGRLRRGLCETHYKSVLRSGDLSLWVSKRVGTPEDRRQAVQDAVEGQDRDLILALVQHPKTLKAAVDAAGWVLAKGGREGD